MRMFFRLITVGVFVLASLGAADAQAPAGDKDDQFVVTGCVTRAADVRTASPHGPFVWSRGDLYLSSPTLKLKPSETGRPVGTAGTELLTFYWIEDEDDFAKYAGQQVEVVGELSNQLQKGEVEIERHDNVIEVEFDVNGREATAHIPTPWLGPAAGDKEFEFDVVVRTVDVEKVTVMGACASR